METTIVYSYPNNRNWDAKLHVTQDHDYVELKIQYQETDLSPHQLGTADSIEEGWGLEKITNIFLVKQRQNLEKRLKEVEYELATLNASLGAIKEFEKRLTPSLTNLKTS